MGSLQSLNMDAMLRTTFVPDYSVRAVTEVVYITIKRTLYLAAKRATLMERSQRVGDQSHDALDDEVEKLLHSLEDDERSIGADTANLMMQTPKMQSKTVSPTNVLASVQQVGKEKTKKREILKRKTKLTDFCLFSRN